MAANNNNAEIWREAIAATKDCPTLEVLERVMEESSPDPKIAAHVADCPHCQSEIAMLRSFESSDPTPDEGAAVAWIAAQLQKRQSAPVAQNSAMVVPFWRSLFRVPYMAAAAALIIAITVGISLHNSDDGKPGFNSGPTNQTIYRGELRLTTPTDLSQAPQQLTWEAVPGAASYRVVVSDVTNEKLWQASSSGNSINVNPELKAKMVPGKPLNWKVSALDANGNEIGSGSGKLKVEAK
jgi:hypothetical protein